MCTGGAPSAPSAPKFKDPRRRDPEYLAVAADLGYVNKKGDPVIKNPKQLYYVDKEIANRQEQEYKDQLDARDKAAAEQRAQDLAIAQQQFEEMSAMQQRQFNESMAAQERALQSQLAAQEAMQKRAEEASLRSQVPQFTSNSSNARRVRANASAKERARQAARGTSQLRVPLSISNSSSSPVKLNIGS